MVRHCIAYGCVNRSNKPECSKLSWHSLPINNAKLLRTWLLRMKRKDPPVSKHSYLCSQHFSEDCFKRCVGGKRYLKSGSVLTRFSFTPEEKPKRKAPVDRSAADIPFQEDGFPSFITDKAEAAKSKEELLIEQLKEKEEEVSRLKECLQVQRKELEEKLFEKKMKRLEQERELRKELESTLQHSLFNIDNIKSNAKLLRFYTGFPNYEVFSTVLSFLGKGAASKLVYSNTEQNDAQKREKAGPKRTLSVEQEFFLVLCRYKVGLLEEDLAARFRISQSLVSRIIIARTKFMYYQFKELDIFPDRQIIELHKPACFTNKYKGTTVIIDLTEIYIEKPSKPEAQQLTFSTYKNTNTLKALVGITPGGSLCFISDLYGGCISDKEITSKSGFIDKLQQGDEVMADRGFNIQELLASKGVKVNVPPFMNQSGQFTEQEMVATRRIATLRIHVERAIERIRNYHI
ncbi:uncharacterized protein LOC111331706 [Stylophora pistillata]|uniref:THAP domain-containing protein 1 n=1 Tax=Stylophora pistillata TaxID=50429 RepID=A0A2B4S6H8_STYPI|nr:uncharacterized protein LOC111331706 [Stylophora pistillata]PFX24400.1 THAP domain-containing protein 1 [Stylophora pistillata]